jgi:DNA-binding response OmpR family regulator
MCDKEKEKEKDKDKDKEKAPKPEKKEIIILAVDDTVMFLNLLKLAFQCTDYKLICVNSGKAALRYLQNNKADLLILDIEMPEMNGYELAIKIRERGYTAPIIFLTASATEGDVRKAVEAGGVDYIVKPIDREQVLSKIKKYV